MKDLKDLRQSYTKGQLEIIDTDENPIVQFEHWFSDANISGVYEPNAFTLSTVNASQQPRSRIVLLKGVEHDKFIFYTNYNSAKSQELLSNPNVSMCFLWHELERQVRIYGVAEKVSRKSSEEYFHSRPRESQIGAWASPQSQVVADSLTLRDHYSMFEKKFADMPIIPLPDFWGGWAIVPSEIEFWQGRPSRMHDRILYSRLGDDSWTRSRLAP